MFVNFMDGHDVGMFQLGHQARFAAEAGHPTLVTHVEGVEDFYGYGTFQGAVYSAKDGAETATADFGFNAIFAEVVWKLIAHWRLLPD